MRGRGVLLVICCLGGSGALRLDNAREECSPVRFGSTPYLEGVQTLSTNVTPLPFEHFRHSNGMQGLFVYPQKQFAMCTMAKNSCSSWSIILEKLVCGTTAASAPNYQLKDEFWSEDAADEVFRNPASVRALWVRDPLERFLSGFLDKCMTSWGGNYQVNCIFRDRSTGQKQGFPLSQAEQWFEAGNSIERANEHFQPQSGFCELRTRLHEYNVIGLMTGSDYVKNARCLLQQAGLLWLDATRDGHPFFVENKKAHPGIWETNNTEILKRFFTKDFAYRLLDVFKEDYDLFRLKRPAWVDEASGEWFNLPAGQIKVPISSGDDEGEDGEDDLATLAERAGFSLQGA